jgi:ethanolamine-phosphate phospho-lyase
MNKLLQTEFGLTAFEVKKLNGYDNVNYLVKTKTAQYIFKTYNYSEDTFEMVDAENKTLFFLQKSAQNKYPTPIQYSDGSFIKILNIKGEKQICRMLTFLEGEFLGDIKHTKQLIQSFGDTLAATDLKLRGFKNYTIAAKQWEWDIQYLTLNEKYIDAIQQPNDRNLVRYFFQQFKENVIPIAPTLRKQIIHNDANDWNVLATNGEISGIIDFGDLAHTFLINELAAAIPYVCFNKEHPLEWASLVIKSYHKKLPLQEKEVKVLYYLIAARLLISVCNSAHSKVNDPENSYASISEKSAWKLLYHWLTINPVNAENTFRIAIDLPPLETPSVDQVIQKRYAHISPLLSLSYDQPIHMVGAAFQYMYGADGQTFLDAYNNIPHVGHSHPRVVASGQRQMAKLNTNTRYLYDQLADYAEKVLSKFPEKLNKIYFVNSGSEATDLAIRMAKNHTKNESVMVMEHGYHGHTQSAIDISAYKFNNPKGKGQKDTILKTTIPDTYRGKYTINDGSAGKMYATDLIDELTTSNRPIAAFIAEPVVGCGGQVPLAKGYLKEVYPAIRAQGGVCISDEVQTGFGRLGEYFWGFEAQDVIPDLVIIGKPMANGHPMGAVVCTDEIAQSFSKGVEFFSSFGGNPVSCAIASTVLEVIEEEELQENAKVVGAYYKALFVQLQEKYTCIGDVRGNGLFIGIEIVKDNSLEPDTELAHLIKNQLRNKNILISTDGPFDSVLKTKPPLCFTKENALLVVSHVEKTLDAHYHKNKAH